MKTTLPLKTFLISLQIILAFLMGQTAFAQNATPNIRVNTSDYSKIDQHWGVWCFKSENGGATYTPAVNLSDTLDVDFGEVNIANGADDQFLALWKDNRVGGEIENLYLGKTDIVTFNDEIIERNDYSVYPNPNNGVFSIELCENPSNTMLTVYDIRGAIRYQMVDVKASTVMMDLDIEEGLYLIRIRNNDDVRTLKVLIQ